MTRYNNLTTTLVAGRYAYFVFYRYLRFTKATFLTRVEFYDWLIQGGGKVLRRICDKYGRGYPHESNDIERHIWMSCDAWINGEPVFIPEGSKKSLLQMDMLRRKFTQLRR